MSEVRHSLRVALAQINPTVGDLSGNVEKIKTAMKEAAAARADLVVTPELALCGYPPEDLLLRPAFLRDCALALEEVVQASAGLTSLVGFPNRLAERVFNAAAVISDQRLLGFYHKVELPNYGVFDEKRYFQPGEENLDLCWGGVSMTPTICEDVWIAGGRVERWAVANDSEVIINLSASPFYAGKVRRRQEVLTRFARRTGAYLCYCNLVGGQDELVFDGGSMVLTPTGEILAAARRFEEDLLIADLPLRKSEDQACWNGKEAKAVGKRNLVMIEPRMANSPPPPNKNLRRQIPAELSSQEEIYTALVLGTRDYARKNGFTKAVVGLSGGIDSALTASLAVAALGPDNVVGVSMPSAYTSRETRLDAARVAVNLGIPLLTVPISRIFENYLSELSEVWGNGDPGVAAENLQARIRGNLLMALSNKFGWLVLTTGNKSETAVGYCTLYGDMAGGFAVLKDVPKTLVYELAEYVNERAGREVIPESVVARPPTAELRPGQRDEDSLPPYSALDPILKAYVEEDESPEEMVAAGADPEMVAAVIRMVDRSEYKRRQAPPGVKITPRAFGRDRRLPITNHYQPPERGRA